MGVSVAPAEGSIAGPDLCSRSGSIAAVASTSAFGSRSLFDTGLGDAEPCPLRGGAIADDPDVEGSGTPSPRGGVPAVHAMAVATATLRPIQAPPRIPAPAGYVIGISRLRPPFLGSLPMKAGPVIGIAIRGSLSARGPGELRRRRSDVEGVRDILAYPIMTIGPRECRHPDPGESGVSSGRKTDAAGGPRTQRQSPGYEEEQLPDQKQFPADGRPGWKETRPHCYNRKRRDGVGRVVVEKVSNRSNGRPAEMSHVATARRVEREELWFRG